MAASPLQKLIRKLESITQLTPTRSRLFSASQRLLRNCIPTRMLFEKGTDRGSAALFWKGSYVVLRNSCPMARVRCTTFRVPGDIPDLQSLHLSVMDHNLSAIWANKVAFIPHDPLRDLTHAYPLLADKLWRDTLVDAAIFRSGSSMLEVEKPPAGLPTLYARHSSS